MRDPGRARRLHGEDHDEQEPVQPAHREARPPAERRSACTEKAPDAGIAADISPSIRITSIASAPAIRYESTMAGPATAMPAPEPTKRPAPITLPSPSIVR